MIFETKEFGYNFIIARMKVLERDEKIVMDNFVTFDRSRSGSGWLIEGNCWDEQEQSRSVTLPLMLIDPLEGPPGVYIIDGVSYWCEYPALD